MIKREKLGNKKLRLVINLIMTSLDILKETKPSVFCYPSLLQKNPLYFSMHKERSTVIDGHHKLSSIISKLPSSESFPSRDFMK